jgi:hypothetical protein
LVSRLVYSGIIKKQNANLDRKMGAKRPGKKLMPKTIMKTLLISLQI